MSDDLLKNCYSFYLFIHLWLHWDFSAARRFLWLWRAEATLPSSVQHGLLSLQSTVSWCTGLSNCGMLACVQLAGSRAQAQ